MTQLVTTTSDNIPGFKVAEAVEKKVEKNLLFFVGGGLGDQVCALPTIRYALDHFLDCQISVVTPNPVFFQRLEPKLKDIFHYGINEPNVNNYLAFFTHPKPDDFIGNFLSPNTINCVDYPALATLRAQLPVAYKQIELSPRVSGFKFEQKGPCAVVHPGRTWPSRTFPKLWWDSLLAWLKHYSVHPILIGHDSAKTGTVEVDPTDCTDLRNKLSSVEMISVLQNAHVVVTNDSAPLHFAASIDPEVLGSGHAWIGYVSTVKHPDYLTHFRNGIWGLRMEAFHRSGLWAETDLCPNRLKPLDLRNLPETTINAWLPDPSKIANWAAEKWSGFDG